MWERFLGKLIEKKPEEQKHASKTFLTQAISQKDHVQEGTNVSLPDDENVTAARNWVNQNKK